MQNDILLVELAREIANRMDADSLMDFEDIASMLKCNTRTVSNGFCKQPDFPQPVRLPNGNGGVTHPRFFRGDIVAWIKNNRNTAPKAKPVRAGRPRLPTDF